MKNFNKNSLLKSLVLASALACLFAGKAAAQKPEPPPPMATPTPAQANRVNVDALREETQKSLPDSNRMTLIWWIPEEFWEATLAEDSTPKAQAEEFLKTVRPYVMFAVVDGTMGAFGGLTYKSEEVIRSTIQVVDMQGVVHRPLSDDKVDPDTKNLLAIMKPVLSNMMGKMGENMHFVVFPARDAAGRKLADPTKEGTFSLKLGSDVYKWRLPLGSLLPAKVCPVDGEVMNGAWKFCHWHGDKLVTKP
ncbi:MAG TPA: hypothetical protein VGP08_08460 [Pyrinomonadaceae bacterium]|jgi:hypothetical protein|nr:hypothetical protein [Pyrinomonadaceae bacterium]